MNLIMPWLAVTPAERLAGIRHSYSQDLVDWSVWGPVLLAVMAGLTLLVLARLWAVRRQAAQSFVRLAHGAGLGKDEQAVLVRVAAAAGLKRPDSIFTMEDAFDRGASLFLADPRTAALPPEARKRVHALVDDLQQKLGFGQARGQDAAAHEAPVIRRGPLARGDHVTILRRSAAGSLRGVVTMTTRLGVSIQLDGRVDYRAGDAWRVRHVKEGLQWEYDVVVADGMDEHVNVRLAGSPRRVNLRRFVRVATRRPARAAMYPFVADGAEPAAPVLVDATLVEMAGPGLRFETSLWTQVGDRVLVVFQLDAERIVQGVARVRRAAAGAGDRHEMAVEMVGLTDAEVGELVRETNVVARFAAARVNADADDAGDAADDAADADEMQMPGGRGLALEPAPTVAPAEGGEA
jgi:hypothetical protein